MSHWMTSGRNRLKEKEGRSSFGQRAQARARFDGFQAPALKKRSRNDPKNIQENHPRFYKRTVDLGSSRSCPIARRGIVAAAPRRIVEDSEDFLRENIGPPSLQPRRIRDPNTSRFAHGEHYRRPLSTRSPSYGLQRSYQKLPSPQSYRSPMSLLPPQAHHSPVQPQYQTHISQPQMRQQQVRSSVYLRPYSFQYGQQQQRYCPSQPSPQYQQFPGPREYSYPDYAPKREESATIWDNNLNTIETGQTLARYQKVSENQDPCMSRSDDNYHNVSRHYEPPQYNQKQHQTTNHNVQLYPHATVYDDYALEDVLEKDQDYSIHQPVSHNRGAIRGIWPPSQQQRSSPMEASWSGRQHHQQMATSGGIWPPSQSSIPNPFNLNWSTGNHHGLLPIQREPTSRSVPVSHEGDSQTLSFQPEATECFDTNTQTSTVFQTSNYQPTIFLSQADEEWQARTEIQDPHLAFMPVHSLQDVTEHQQVHCIAKPAAENEKVYSTELQKSSYHKTQLSPAEEERPPPVKYVGVQHKAAPKNASQSQRQEQQQPEYQQPSKNRSDHGQPLKQIADEDRVKPGCVDYSQPFAGTYQDFVNPRSSEETENDTLTPMRDHIPVPREVQVHTSRKSPVAPGSPLSVHTKDVQPVYTQNNNKPINQYQPNLRYYNGDCEIDFETGFARSDWIDPDTPDEAFETSALTVRPLPDPTPAPTILYNDDYYFDDDRVPRPKRPKPTHKPTEQPTAVPTAPSAPPTSAPTGTTGAYKLVFSDEFNAAGRTFHDGQDARWTAMNKNDYTNNAQHYYSPNNAFTNANGELVIQTEAADTEVIGYDDIKRKKTHVTKHFRSGMIQTWNKFCFTGGIIEAEVVLPGKHDVGGLWPAFWLLGNLARHTYVGSSEHIWPWSEVNCTKKSEASQLLSGCHKATHYGMKPGVGRGAPEIDIFEVQPGNVHAGLEPFDQMPVGQPFMSTSFQIAPGRPVNRPGPGYWPGPGQWYQGLIGGENSTLNIQFYGNYNHFRGDYDPAKSDYWSDAVSYNRQLSQTHFKKRHKYRLEWEVPTDERYGHLNWFLDDKLVLSINGKSIADAGLGGEISSEPSYILFNTAVSSEWGFPKKCPANCPCKEFDCNSKDFRKTCGFSEGFCTMMQMKPEMRVNYVRVYQNPNDPTQKVGCSTPERPTRQYIEAHQELYKQATDETPLKALKTGGGTCQPEAKGAKAEACGGKDRGQCSRRKVCKCRTGWTGTNCLSHRGTDPILYDSPDQIADVGFELPFATSKFLISGLAILIAFFILSVRWKNSMEKWTPIPDVGKAAFQS